MWVAPPATKQLEDLSIAEPLHYRQHAILSCPIHRRKWEGDGKGQDREMEENAKLGEVAQF